MSKSLRRLLAALIAALLIWVAAACEFHNGLDAAGTARYHCEQSTALWRVYYPNAVFYPSTIVRVDNPGTFNDFDACLASQYSGLQGKQVYMRTYYLQDDRVEFDPIGSKALNYELTGADAIGDQAFVYYDQSTFVREAWVITEDGAHVVEQTAA